MEITYNAPKTRRSGQETACVESTISEHVSTQQGQSTRCGEAKVYALGYSVHSKRIHELMAENPKMLMIDTRFVAFSQIPGWSGDDLKDKYGDRYRYAGKVLGNRNYKSKDKPIRIADPVRGIAGLRRYLDEEYSLVLVCGCKNYDACHLKVICELLNVAMPQAQIVLPDSAPEHKKPISQPFLSANEKEQPLTLFDEPAIEMPVKQEAMPEVVIAQPCCVCGNPASNVSLGGEHYCSDCYVCWKCKFPPRWTIDPVDGTNVCACIVEMREYIEMMQPKWDATRKRVK